MAGRDEPADKGSAERTDEDSQRVQRDGHSPIGVVVDIGQHSWHDSELTGATQAGEEATDDQRLNILGGGRGDGKDAPDQHGDRQGPFSPSQLRPRSPDHGTSREAENVEGRSQGSDLGRDAKVLAGALDPGGEDAAGEGDDQSATAD